MAGKNDGNSATPAKRSRLRRALRAGALILGVAIAAVAVVVTIKTLGLGSKQVRVEWRENEFPNGTEAARRLGQAVRIQTISTEEGPPRSEAFAEMHELIATSFPRVHEHARREVIGGSSLLFTLQGKASEKPAAIFLAHMDVVPVRAGEWTVDPFGGAVKDGFVWGRGALDDKSSLMGLLEACEYLLASGWEPTRTIYFAFGHDEEIGGADGAARIAALLHERGVQAEFALDEGLAVTEGVLEGLDVPLALVGIAEKGFANVALVATGPGGHGSMPGPDNATARLARALTRLEKKPFPAVFTHPVESMLDHVAPELPLGRRVALANRWLTGPFLTSQLESRPSSNAVLRTTVAPTMLQAGEKPNVLASRATATLNVRIRPGSSVSKMLAGLRRRIADPRVTVELMDSASTSEPSSLSAINSPAFERMAHVIRGSLRAEAVVAPGLVVGQTDSRHFQKIAQNVYRFAPYVLRRSDLPRVHGADERIGVDTYSDLIWFYAELMRSL